jgi:hypothetical protein
MVASLLRQTRPTAVNLHWALDRMMVKGQAASSIDSGCLPALTVDAGIVTGVVADPPLDAIRACNGTVSFSSESSSGSAAAPAVASTSATTIEPAATTTP